MSLIGKWVCVSSGVHNDLLYVFQVEFETKTTIGHRNKYGKHAFKKSCIFVISNNKQQCAELQNAIDKIDKQCTALSIQRRELLQQAKEKHLQ